ncbi:hypothetical protein RHGRI_006850 [Rhododendron griersonianum]|uniref:Uncharacterized protein n=1 Tax=Rhododendron griersonianum TaxID=479676 RepID=A0AAV6KVW1_9ERIC|nr:hypothetical protein RHGRI_006850 [Rhododendron griersonianum]
MAQETTTISEAVLKGMLEWCNADFKRCSELIRKIGQSVDHFEPSSSPSSPSPDCSSSSPSPDCSSSSSLDQQLEPASEASLSIPRILFFIFVPIVVPWILSPLTSLLKHSVLLLQVAFDRDTDKIQRDLDLIDTRSLAGFSLPGGKFHKEHFLGFLTCGRQELPLINSHSDLDMALDSLEPILSGLDFLEQSAGKVWWTSRHDTEDLSYLQRLREVTPQVVNRSAKINSSTFIV